MLLFDDKFFLGETRSGFYIESEMKRCWAVELDVLAEVDRVCEEYGLKYNIMYGSLLGTVRHRGFVPWDDDIDICVLRQDYQRLMQVLPDELPGGYVVNSVYTTDSLDQPIGSVINRANVTTNPIELAVSYGSPYVSGIDVFPFDYVPRDPEMSELQRSLYNVLYDAAQRFDDYSKTGEIEQYIPMIEELLAQPIDRSGNVRAQLWKYAEQIASMFTEEESDLVTWMPTRVMAENPRVCRKEWFDGYVRMPFENFMAPVPIGYDSMLKAFYGDDYMVPRTGAAGHDYPYYKSQKKWMIEHGMVIPAGCND